MDLEIARNPLASPETLDGLVDKFVGTDRPLGEALLLNPSLSVASLSRLLPQLPLDLAILAIKHPNLSPDDQVYIILAIPADELRTKAKLILLDREDLGRDVLVVLCLDPNESVREKAQEILSDPNRYSSE